METVEIVRVIGNHKRAYDVCTTNVKLNGTCNTGK